MSGKSRDCSSTEGSTFFAVAWACALSKHAAIAGSICRKTGTEARYIEIVILGSSFKKRWRNFAAVLGFSAQVHNTSAGSPKTKGEGNGRKCEHACGCPVLGGDHACADRSTIACRRRNGSA